MNQQMEEMLQQIWNSKNYQRNKLNKRQKENLVKLEEYVHAKMFEIVNSSSLKEFDKKANKLKKEVKKRIDEIVNDDSVLILSALSLLFYRVYKLNITTMLAIANNPINVVFGNEESIISEYKSAIKGEYYETALKRLSKRYSRHLEDDLKWLKQRYKNENFIATNLEKRTKSNTDEFYGYFDLIHDQELHRVSELAKLEGAELIKKNSLSVTKTWLTRRDNKVRDTKEASHVAMNNKTIDIDKLFKLVPYGETMAPCLSGIPQQDINCRCEAIYSIV